MSSVAVVLSFFSPVGYTLPQRHFHAVVQTLHAQGVPLVVTQGRYPGQQPQRVPACIPQAVYDTRSFAFHKERLWNLGARLTDAERLIFIDADVVFSTSEWLARSVELLDRVDVIQPYETAVWLDENGRTEMERQPTLAAVAAGVQPRFCTYHPGFGLGMTREAFDALGGIYDRAISGNGDALFCLGLRDTSEHRAVEAWYGRRQDPTVHCPSYLQWKRRAASLGLSAGVTPGVRCVHLWHGRFQDRQYITRARLFPRRDDGEFDTIDDDDGLLEWRDVAAANAAAEPYFIGRRDDG